MEMHRMADGEIQFTDTGDAMIDKWEEELARGLIPDLSEVISPETIKQLEARRGKGVKGMTMKEVMERAGRESAKLDHNQHAPQRRQLRTFGE